LKQKKNSTNTVETNATHTLYCIRISHRVLGFRDNKIKPNEHTGIVILSIHLLTSYSYPLTFVFQVTSPRAILPAVPHMQGSGYVAKIAVLLVFLLKSLCPAHLNLPLSLAFTAIDEGHASSLYNYLKTGLSL
jgi:hypothetical protein